LSFFISFAFFGFSKILGSQLSNHFTDFCISRTTLLLVFANHIEVIAAVASLYPLHIVFSIQFSNIQMYQDNTGIIHFLIFFSITFAIFEDNLTNISFSVIQFSSQISTKFDKSILFEIIQFPHIDSRTFANILQEIVSQYQIIGNILSQSIFIE
jgi:1-aminocyclopropane-1-carboxylate deaminase/D-cysteine desulfhydrase-like pyridoxal-dependent ACC family enzyme